MKAHDLIMLGGEFARIDAKARGYSEREQALVDLADNDGTLHRMLRCIVERAFVMGYQSACVDAAKRADAEPQGGGDGASSS